MPKKYLVQVATSDAAIAGAAAALRETSGPANLTVGAVSAGQLLARSGSTLVGQTGAAPTGAAGGDLGGSYPSPTVEKLNFATSLSLASSDPSSGAHLKYDGTNVTGSEEVEVTGTVTTADATTTTIATKAVSTDRIAVIKGTAKGYDATGNEGAAFEIWGAFRNDAGTLTQIGSTQTIATVADVGAALWTATLDVSGTSIRVRVTGEAATTIEWEFVGQFSQHG